MKSKKTFFTNTWLAQIHTVLVKHIKDISASIGNYHRFLLSQTFDWLVLTQGRYVDNIYWTTSANVMDWNNRGLCSGPKENKSVSMIICLFTQK